MLGPARLEFLHLQCRVRYSVAFTVMHQTWLLKATEIWQARDDQGVLQMQSHFHPSDLCYCFFCKIIIHAHSSVQVLLVRTRWQCERSCRKLASTGSQKTYCSNRATWKSLFSFIGRMTVLPKQGSQTDTISGCAVCQFPPSPSMSNWNSSS